MKDLRKNVKYLFLVLLLVFLDQVTKYLVRANFRLNETRQIFSFLALTYTTNTGIVFGLFPGANMFFIVVVVLVLILVLISAKDIVDEFSSLGKFAICLILSGGVGNLIDRISLGKVVDFIDLQWNYKNIWPIFNLADSYVFVGVWIIALSYIIKEIKLIKEKKNKDATHTS